jgi:CxxC-x17-CxxC domain-containing protein
MVNNPYQAFVNLTHRVYAHTRFSAVFHWWNIIIFPQLLDDQDSNRRKKEVIPMSYSDKQITCSDCGTAFTFSTKDQEFFASKGFTNEPKRCPTCRAAKKQSMGDNSNYGGGSYGSRSGGSAPRQMFPVKCATCGKDTEVPFEPRTGRPVYCSDCYRKTNPVKRY